MSGTPEVLLVEDDPDELELTLGALQETHFAKAVHVARDGAEAIEFLFAEGRYANVPAPPKIDLVLLDLKLPLVDGIEVLRCIKSDPRTRPTVVVVLTSSKHESDVLSTYDLGANSYVAKPVDVDKFVDAIRDISTYWTVLNQRPER
jgi:CheY-like chemotaxis protein